MPESTTEAPLDAQALADGPRPDAAVLADLYGRMRLIREVEERLRVEYASRNIRGPIHLSIGQEGIAAAVHAAARPSDVCLSTHRNHAHYLSKGGDLQGMIDEIYGLESGCTGGVGGSMHLFDDRVGMWGSSAIVGGSTPMAVGLALAKKRLGTGDIAIAWAGDGATDEGVFWESLNLAALLRLPVLFVVEQNDFSTNSTFAVRQAGLGVIAKARAFGVAAERIDGDDAAECWSRVSAAIAAVRRDSTPRLFEATTSRLCAHVGPSYSVDAPKGAYEDWPARVAREPLALFRTRFGAAPGLDLAAIDAAVVARVDEAFERGKAGFARANSVMKLEAPPPPNPNRV